MTEPIFEAEDIGCACHTDGVESEWVWDEDKEMYVCEGCGMTQ